MVSQTVRCPIVINLKSLLIQPSKTYNHFFALPNICCPASKEKCNCSYTYEINYLKLFLISVEDENHANEPILTLYNYIPN